VILPSGEFSVHGRLEALGHEVLVRVVASPAEGLEGLRFEPTHEAVAAGEG
jgi:hypothetical protein